MKNYALSHVGSRFGEKYEEHIRSGFYSLVWEDLEKPILTKELSRLRPANDPALDLACGTGRVTGHVAGSGFAARGIDISEDMLAVARRRHPAATFARADITQCSDGARYRLITAFRFFQNADPGMQRAALDYIGRALADDGIAVVNLHANPSSPYGMYHRARRILGLAAHRGTSLAAWLALVPDTLYVDRVIPYAFFPRFLFLHPALRSVALASERLCAALPPALQKALAQQVIIVLRKAA